MKLIKLYAFSLFANKGNGKKYSALGGQVQINNEIEKAINNNFVSSKLDQAPMVDLNVNLSTRTNDIRDSVINLAHGNSLQSISSATSLANRLADSMDLRTPPCLFIIAVSSEKDFRNVSLWIFPKEEAFKFQLGKEPTVEILRDIFSQSSHLRKAALFIGRNYKNDYLQGRVVDFQSGSPNRYVADFWIYKFLDCKSSVSDEAGTRILSNTFKKAFEKASTSEEREKLFSSVFSLKNMPQKKWSIQEIADHFLDGTVKNLFLSQNENEEVLPLGFNIDQEILNNTLQFRLFELKSGVFVSSPFSEIGQTVKIEGDETRILSVQDEISSDRIRSRHA